VTLFDLCRQFASTAVMDHLGMNATEFRNFCGEEVLKLNAALPEPYGEEGVRATAAACASWARNNLVNNNPNLFKTSQRAMAARRQGTEQDPTR
jgi:hypothetical protein